MLDGFSSFLHKITTFPSLRNALNFHCTVIFFTNLLAFHLKAIHLCTIIKLQN